jgi:hypothetical protein
VTLEYGDPIPDDNEDPEKVGLLAPRLYDNAAGSLVQGGQGLRGKLPLGDDSNGWTEEYIANNLNVENSHARDTVLRLELTEPRNPRSLGFRTASRIVPTNFVDDRLETNAVGLLSAILSTPSTDSRYTSWQLIRRSAGGGFTGSGSVGFPPENYTIAGTYTCTDDMDVVYASGSINPFSGALTGFPTQISETLSFTLDVVHTPSHLPGTPVGVNPNFYDGSGSVSASYEIVVSR